MRPKPLRRLIVGVALAGGLVLWGAPVLLPRHASGAALASTGTIGRSATLPHPAQGPDGASHAPLNGGAGLWRVTPRPFAVNLLVATGGLGLILLELWWFLGVKPPGAQARAGDDGVQTVTITVDGGYQPSRIRVQAGRPVRLAFHRLDPSGCVAQVLFPDFHRVLDLPLGETTVVKLLPQKAGSFPFHCGMNMVRGVLEVEEAPGDQTPI